MTSGLVGVYASDTIVGPTSDAGTTSVKAQRPRPLASSVAMHESVGAVTFTVPVIAMPVTPANGTTWKLMVVI